VALVLIGLAFVGMAVVTVKRCAFLRRRMGDVGVFLRAGWAVRTSGQHLYRVADDNDWHYCYPPAFAVLMAPLADPPSCERARVGASGVGLLAAPGAPGPLLAASAAAACPVPFEADPAPMLPFGASVTIFCLINLSFLLLAVHLLASALEKASGHPEVRAGPVGSRRWWWLRIVPVLACLPAIGHTLTRGQTNLWLLLAVSAFTAALLRRRSLQAGLWLAGAICLKVFPAFLLLVPLIRRDGRCFLGCALGLAVGLGLLPWAALGTRGTVCCYEEFAQVMLAPALHLGADRSRGEELLEMNATDNQSFEAMIHNTRYLHIDRCIRPVHPSPAVSRAHWLLGGSLTLVTLLVGWGHRFERGPAAPLFVGALTLLMALLSPVCHSHYFVLSIPVVMGLVALAWERETSGAADAAAGALLLAYAAGCTLPLLPGGDLLRDAGLVTYLELLLWLAACLALVRGRWKSPVSSSAPGVRGPLAA
jgi:hypothetical protein